MIAKSTTDQFSFYFSIKIHVHTVGEIPIENHLASSVKPHFAFHPSWEQNKSLPTALEKLMLIEPEGGTWRLHWYNDLRQNAV